MGTTHFAARCNILLRADSSSVFVMWFPDPDEELFTHKDTCHTLYN